MKDRNLIKFTVDAYVCCGENRPMATYLGRMVYFDGCAPMIMAKYIVKPNDSIINLKLWYENNLHAKTLFLLNEVSSIIDAPQEVIDQLFLELV